MSEVPDTAFAGEDSASIHFDMLPNGRVVMTIVYPVGVRAVVDVNLCAVTFAGEDLCPTVRAVNELIERFHAEGLDMVERWRVVGDDEHGNRAVLGERWLHE